MGLEHDISCLYAAKNFVPHLQLEQPKPIQPQSQFSTSADEIIGKYVQQTWNQIKEREQELEALEDGTEEEEQKSQSIILGLCAPTYEQLRKEITKEYRQQKKAGRLTQQDEQEYHQFISELSPGYLFMLAVGFANKEVQQNLPLREQKVRKELDEWRQQQDKKHEDYLASADINTPEGKTAWKVAHNAAYHFNSIIYFGEEYGIPSQRPGICASVLEESELEKHVSIGIATGILCAKESAIIANEDAFTGAAMRWLLQEIKQRLDKGIEFTLLDAVSVKKGNDGLIYLRLDKRELYQ